MKWLVKEKKQKPQKIQKSEWEVGDVRSAKSFAIWPIKAKQFQFELKDAVLASDAFFPFDDCVKMSHAEQISAFIQPGGSIRDKDSIEYCKQHQLAMVITGLRHFRH